MELNTAISGLADAEAAATRVTRSGLVSATLVALIGAVVIFITPGFLALIAQQTGFDNDRLGYLVAWDINAMGVTIGLSTFALARVPWRPAVALGLALIAAGNLLTASVTSFAPMVAARVVAGAGEGIAVGFAFAALGRATNPDRVFSIYLVIGALLSSAFLYALPGIQTAVRPGLVFTLIGALAALIILSLRAFPDGSRDEPDLFAGGGKLDLRLAGGSLLGVFMLFFAMGAVWSYSERIGLDSKLPPGVIAQGLSIGTLAGVVGAGVAGFLPRRWGRSLPLIVSGAAGVVSFLMYDGQVAPRAFVIATVLMMFSWNFAQPLLSGICSEACHRGRVVCAMGSIQTFGTGLGPAAAAATLATGSFRVMLYAACAVLALSVAVTVATIAGEGRRAETV
ncbi:MAG TPA: MFS transporter [Novosphingobium sp.]|nr:MFS transporter [Novosphingobium sp.]